MTVTKEITSWLLEPFELAWLTSLIATKMYERSGCYVATEAADTIGAMLDDASDEELIYLLAFHADQLTKEGT